MNWTMRGAALLGLGPLAIIAAAEAPPGVSPTDVGVIPNTECPSGSETIIIHMDDEDDDNRNAKTGWYGAISGGVNTDFKFCRVDGTQFKQYGDDAEEDRYYAVLKLGTTCPAGSVTISRYFDNEDDNNRNSSIGNIYPNVSSANTTLYFCLFRPGTPSGPHMMSFPSIEGMSHYGVFAAPQFVGAIERGSVHTDDEDDDNRNTFTAPGDVAYHARQIISGDTNTTLFLARVR